MIPPRFFRDLPLQGKLRAVILLVAGVAVAGAGAAFLAYDWISSRNAVSRQMETMARIVADQSTAALEFEQAPQAAALLATLRSERQIAVAALYSRSGALFARYLRDDVAASRVPAAPGADGRSFEGGELLLFVPVVSGPDRIGTLHLRSDLSLLRARMGVSLAVAALVLGGAGLATLLLSKRLGARITAPLQRLSGAVHAVSERKDYSLRVEPGGGDEMGRLIDAFNDMLVQIRQRDDALARGRDELELRVQDRTRELEEKIAARKEAERRLEEKDARLTEAQSVARLGSWDWDFAGGATLWSDEVYRISGRLPAQLGARFEDFLAAVHPDDRAALKNGLDAARARLESFGLDFRLLRPDGSVRWVRSQSKIVLDDAGRPLRQLGILQDVTERREAEEAIQTLNGELERKMTDLAAANKELEGFSYSVSHDLRAPLRAIDGFSRMLLEEYPDRLDERGKRYLTVIGDNTRKMGQLIDDLLSFSRLGRKPVEPSAVDMTRLAREAFEELKPAFPGRDVDLRLSELPAAVGDPAMLRQVWVNLVSNAVKYSKGRTPAIVEIDAVSSPSGLAYRIRDNGVGFDMEYAHKLFGVFQRLHSTREFEGTGVGLALVQRIVQKHGGRIWAESRVNEGATFHFTIPAPAASAAAG